MIKIICKKEYDTEKSEIVKKFAYGNFGDADGYEETVYLTPDGSYFLYVNGGAESRYTKEDIKRMSKKTALDFINK